MDYLSHNIILLSFLKMDERSEGKEKTHPQRTIKGSISSEITRRAVAHHVIHPVRQTEIINTKGQLER